MFAWWMSGILMGLTLMDAGTTQWLLDHGATEINPLMAALLMHGLWVFWVAKVGIGALICLVLRAAWQRDRRRGLIVFSIAGFIMAGIVLVNLTQVAQVR